MKPDAANPTKGVDLLARLKRRYGVGWAFMAEVGNSTGWSCSRHADGLPLGVHCPDCEPCHTDVLLGAANNKERT